MAEKKHIIASSVGIRENMLYVTLDDQRVIELPLVFLPWLAEATPEQQQHYQVNPISIYWPDLEDGLDMDFLLALLPPDKPLQPIQNRLYALPLIESPDAPRFAEFFGHAQHDMWTMFGVLQDGRQLISEFVASVVRQDDDHYICLACRGEWNRGTIHNTALNVSCRVPKSGSIKQNSNIAK